MLDDGFKLKCSVDFKKVEEKERVERYWCYGCELSVQTTRKRDPNLVKQFSHGNLVTQCKQMYKENLHAKEQQFGNVKIAHFGLLLPLFLERKRMFRLEINKNEVERARLVKEANFPGFLCTAKFNFTKPHLLKLC